MKKFPFALIIALSCYCISCSEKGGPSPTAQKNMDAMHGVVKCFDTKDFSKVGDYIAEDIVDHAGEKGDIKGLANLKVEFEKWAGSTENAKSELIKELGDDEYVMGWYRYTGTAKTAQMGVKPGEKYDMKGLEIARFKDGKAVEHWTLMEPAEMMKMMGSMPPPMPMPADTTKKDTVKTM